MQKVCEVCDKLFVTKEGKQKACSNSCGNVLRSRTNKEMAAAISINPLNKKDYLREEDLPPPEVLPSSYLKRCHDYWATLTGDSGDPRRRLA